MEINGEALRRNRERELLTQEDLANRSGVTESTISRLENGLQRARISTVRKLALALGVPPAELIAYAGEAEEGKAAA